MLSGILLDENLGHKFTLVTRRYYRSNPLRDAWAKLAIAVLNLSSLGLQYNSPDDVVWETCQQQGLVLLTCNRNLDGQHSLEETIRRHNRPDSLPVFTVSDPSRFGTERDYDMRLAKDLFEYLMTIDELRGTGRLFVPID
jgi:hypothetical protein